jgi:catechol 2,3-dioxygenase-like lactoylglutathione lyase family enzyme
MIGRMHHVVLDCPDPPALATFYSSLLGLPVTYQDDDWVVVAVNETTSGEDVYGDPAGHPFCLIRRPRWAPPISATR